MSYPCSMIWREKIGAFPQQQVGGNYFDYIRIEDNRTGFCLGDVSGKGLPASPLMANLQEQPRVVPESRIRHSRARRKMIWILDRLRCDVCRPRGD